MALAGSGRRLDDRGVADPALVDAIESDLVRLAMEAYGAGVGHDSCGPARNGPGMSRTLYRPALPCPSCRLNHMDTCIVQVCHVSVSDSPSDTNAIHSPSQTNAYVGDVRRRLV